MRPVDPKYGVSQPFAGMPTAGVIGNINAPTDTVEYWVGRYGDYQSYGHAGTDLKTPVGTPVYASRGGTVIWCDWDVNLPGGPNDWYSRWFFYQAFGGRIVLIQHSSGELDAYAHLSAFKVKYGQVVQEGQLIALSGSSAGGVDGGVDPHLHVERIVDTSYRTGGGLIYGRSNPAVLWKTFKPLTITAQSSTPKEDTMSAEDVKELKDHFNMALYGGTPTKEQLAAPVWRLAANNQGDIRTARDTIAEVKRIAVQNQVDIRATAAKVWATVVNRAGKKIPVLQEIADIKSKVLGIEPVLADIQENTDPDALAAIIPDDLAQQVIDALAARLSEKDAV
jgi:hypothetical protein